MPILKTKKTMGGMKSGQVLEIQSTDPGTKNDLPSFAKRAGHEYLGEKEDQGFVRFYLRGEIGPGLVLKRNGLGETDIWQEN